MECQTLAAVEFKPITLLRVVKWVALISFSLVCVIINQH